MTDELKDPDWDLSRIEYTGDDKSQQPDRSGNTGDSDDNKDGAQ
jgi:hypothetical protein